MKIKIAAVVCCFAVGFIGWRFLEKKACAEYETAVVIASPDEIQERKQLHHLACIMDGNRRWAQQRGMVPWYGHAQGVEAVRRVVQFCLEKEISYLSLYTFSLENFKRSEDENSYLFKLMIQEAEKGVEEFKKHGVRLRFIGDRTLFPSQLAPLLDHIEKETADGKALQANFLFCYGGRQEIAAAVKNIAHQVKLGIVKEDDICPELISDNLWTAGTPHPDLIIRTGSFSRLSNFLLFQAAYSELYVMDCLWPEITAEHLQKAYDAYMNCTRNFGT